MNVIQTEHAPIYSWVTDLEEGALKQAQNLAALPFLHKWVALMPDAHQGYGMPIGGVIATKDVVIPNAVGVDIGCGMCAMRTSLTDISRADLQDIVDIIRREIPVGFSHQSRPKFAHMMPNMKHTWTVEALFGDAELQLGTLGGGNHFIEIQKGSDGYIWIMVHSGSRNLGYRVAKFYNDVAVEENAKWFSSVPAEHELAFLPVGSDSFGSYMLDMQYCVAFALANRSAMMQDIMDAFYDVVPGVQMIAPMVNIAHNYAQIEHHFNQNVIVHRKGATSAKKDELGIIPGSQGTSSYIVKGLGNKLSFNSCSHGAGRKMGRKEAQKKLDLAEQQAILDNQGIIHGITSTDNLDEAPGAYKDIDIVMANQTDLVEILVKLEPLAVVKG